MKDTFICEQCGKRRKESSRVIVGFRPVYTNFNGRIHICFKCLLGMADKANKIKES